jgi:hypothetical protein
MMVLQLEDESGGPYELVAFPKAYEKFKEVLEPDVLLMLQAKVERDRRGEGVQLLLEAAELLDAAAIHAMHPDEPAREPESEQQPMSTASNAPMPNDEEPPLPEPPPDLPAGEMPPTPPPEALSIIRPRSKIAATNGHANGNGSNGHANGNGYANGHAETVAQRSLLLQLPECEYEHGVQIMQEVRGLLEQCLAGENGDQVIIRLPRSSGTVVLKPRDTVQCSGALLGQLRAILGESAVVIE